MGHIIYWAIVSVILSLIATLFMGGGQFAAVAIHDMGLTFGIVAWIGVILAAILIARIVARKYRDYQAIYGQPHHGGNP